MAKKDIPKKKVILTFLACVAIAGLLLAATGDESATLTTSLDKRVLNVNYPVWERVITWTYDSDDEGLETISIPLNGIVLKAILTLPDTVTDTTTSQLLIKDNGGNTIFDSGEQSEGEGVTYTFSLFEPLSGTIDLSIEPSAAYGSEESIVVTLRGI